MAMSAAAVARLRRSRLLRHVVDLGHGDIMAGSCAACGEPPENAEGFCQVRCYPHSGALHHGRRPIACRGRSTGSWREACRPRSAARRRHRRVQEILRPNRFACSIARVHRRLTRPMRVSKSACSWCTSVELSLFAVSADANAESRSRGQIRGQRGGGRQGRVATSP